MPSNRDNSSFISMRIITSLGRMWQLWVSEPIERYCCALYYLHLFLSFGNKTDLSVNLFKYVKDSRA